MAATKLSAKGQVVIPKDVRDSQGWKTGLDLVVEPVAGGVILRPRKAGRVQAAESLLGCTGYSGSRRSLADMAAGIAKGSRTRR